MKKTIGIESRKKGLWIQEDEEEDSLSLSDLSINDIDSEEWEKYYDSKSSTSSSSTSSSYSLDEGVFEFTSNKNNAIPPENILFCGKLIPYGNPNDVQNDVMKKRRRSSFSFSRGKFLGCPTEIELKDLKNRQNRKVASSSKVGGNISDYSRGKGKGILWSLIKKLSCTTGGASYHAQSAVKSSIACISLV